MTDLFARPPTQSEVEEGKGMRMTFAGGDGPPPPVGQGTGLLTAGLYFFRQQTPAEYWIISHGLGHNPVVTVQNTSGSDQIAVIHYVSVNELSIRFSEPTQGFAWCSLD